MPFWENQKVILAYYAQCVKPVCEAYGLTRIEFDILLFLANNPAYDTAADIVRIRMLTKSHVSGALKRLESNGYLCTAYHAGNRKTIHLSLTKKADAIIKEGKMMQERFGKQLFDGFSPEQLDMLKQLLQRMYQNARLGMTEERR